MMKVLWVDTETTGLDPVKNDIITIAGLIQIDGEVKEEFYYKCQPFDWDNISEEALQVNGITMKELKKFDKPQDVHKKLVTTFGKYINKFNKKDKFIPAGHNVPFDVDFTYNFFKKNNDNYFFSYIDYHKLDTLPLALLLKVMGHLDTENVKLETLAKHFEIGIEAHDALSDIKATRELFYKIANNLNYTSTVKVPA